MTPPLKVRLIPRSSDRPGPTDRRRILALRRALSGRGADIDVFDGSEHVDVLVTNTEDFGRWLPLAERLRKKGGRIVYDVTDDVLNSRTSRTYREGLGPWRGLLRKAKDGIKDALGHPRSLRKAEEFWSLCQGIVTGSDSQAESFRKRYPGLPVIALVDPVDLEEYRRTAEHGDRDKVRVVWEGTVHNVPYLSECADALRGFLDSGKIRLRVITDRMREIPWSGFRDNVDILRHLGLSSAEFVDWNLETFSSRLAEGDIGVAPLYGNDEFCRAKPANKLLGYAALKLPVVGSDIPSYREALREGGFGYLAGSTESWREGLSRLIGDPTLRRELGDRGRAYVEANFTVDRFATRYWEFLSGLRS
jgi:glycosyltransferase involved in cell wall biosynthesis